ncbi:MAG: hypothetical protein ABR612_14785 [Chromatocurvus sp.]
MVLRGTDAVNTGRDGAGRWDQLTSVERGTLLLSVLWVLGIVPVFVLSRPGDGTGGVIYAGMALLCALLPPAIAWVGLMLARTMRVVREETDRLEDAIDALHDVCGQDPDDRASDESVLKKLDQIAAAQRDVATAVTKLRAARDQNVERTRTAPEPAPPANDDQVALPLDMPTEAAEAGLARSDFLKALNFPENLDDTAGFTALRRAMRDRSAALMIRAAQDILTLMSQDGIYMDDLTPDMAHPDVWRSFAGGERGRTIAALGGVRDQSALDVVATRMKQDAIFRDVAHHFLRLFDRMLTDFAQSASDAEISELSETRTARAFMLLGRVVGIFD